MAIDLLHFGDDQFQRLAGLADQRYAGIDLIAREVVISALISLAALAERCASSRTSWATTAKPLPASTGAGGFDAGIQAAEKDWSAGKAMSPSMTLIIVEDLARRLFDLLHGEDSLAHHVAGLFCAKAGALLDTARWPTSYRRARPNLPNRCRHLFEELHPRVSSITAAFCLLPPVAAGKIVGRPTSEFHLRRVIDRGDALRPF